MRIAFLLLLSILPAICFCQVKSVTVQVSGLTCAMCSKAVQKSLAKLPFVKEVKPDLNSQEYELIFQDNSSVDLEKIKNNIEDAGFSVARLQVKAVFAGVSIEKNLPVKLGALQLQFVNSEDLVLKGEQTLTLVEKDFLSIKAFKKYCGNAKQKCSSKELSYDGRRIYRVTI